MRTMFTPLKIAGMEVKNRTFMAPPLCCVCVRVVSS